MDATHFHLALTHFPIVGILVGIGILAYAYYVKNEAVTKAALLVFIVMAIIAVPVFLTGEEAEESVEDLPGVSENIMEEHEEIAEKAIWIIGLLGAVSMVGYYAIVKNLSFAKPLILGTMFLSIITFGTFASVGNLGGQIRHSEIRKGNTFRGNEHKEDHHDDDDDHDDD